MTTTLYFTGGVCENVNTPRTLVGHGGIQCSIDFQGVAPCEAVLFCSLLQWNVLMNISHHDGSCKRSLAATSDFTEREVKELYQLGVITTSAYIWLIKRGTQEGDTLTVLDTNEFCSQWGIKKTSFYRAVRQLEAEGLLNTVIGKGTKKKKTEHEIRDRLFALLGGEVEVTTPVGRVDLLTDTALIEIKSIRDWKSAVGQVLAYSQFYPTHNKNLHLFGDKGAIDSIAPLATNTCLSLGVSVSLEIVEGREHE